MRMVKPFEAHCTVRLSIVRRFTASFALFFAVAMPISGCSSKSDSAVPPLLGPIHAISTVNAIARPIDAYTPTVTQVRALYHAADIETAECMKSFGFTVSPNNSSDNFSDLSDEYKMRSALYGFFDPEDVPVKGYDVFVSQAQDSSNGKPLSSAEIGVYTGANKSGVAISSYGGKPVPKGGCNEYGVNFIGGEPPDPGTVGSLPDGGPPIPTSDPRIIAVDQEWSICMKAKGFSYPSPIAAYTDPRWGQARTASATEISTAVADMTCKASTNLMGISVAVEDAYDDRYIQTHTAALAKFHQQLVNAVMKANQIIAAGY